MIILKSLELTMITLNHIQYKHVYKLWNDEAKNRKHPAIQYKVNRVSALPRIVQGENVIPVHTLALHYMTFAEAFP